MNEEHKVSPWEKPGGTLGKIVAAVAAVGGCMLLYSVLPFLITLASNIITLAALVGVMSNRLATEKCGTIATMNTPSASAATAVMMNISLSASPTPKIWMPMKAM